MVLTESYVTFKKIKLVIYKKKLILINVLLFVIISNSFSFEGLSYVFDNLRIHSLFTTGFFAEAAIWDRDVKNRTKN